ncbi:glutathione S-transferase family protein [Sphaerotilus sp.]|uniref:glutathione S-transferase family protein n=1 Tax=Sphaerotilus sp. TaxID=2093942 RepID=UPI00286E28E7|nr:glutathione S-transferase family protein [Sphaerotilus sp.]
MGDAHTLYITAGSGNSFKPMLVLRQRGDAGPGEKVRIRSVDVLAGESRGAAFLRVNPRGQVPFLVTADGQRLGESNAIAWFLSEGTALMPTDPFHRAQALQWMIFEQTALEPNISPARFFSHIVPQRAAEHAQDFSRWHSDGCAGLAVLDAHLRQHAFLCGHGYSVADIAVYGYTHLAGEGGFDLGDWPAIGAWVVRVQAQPDYLGVEQLLSA